MLRKTNHISKQVSQLNLLCCSPKARLVTMILIYYIKIQYKILLIDTNKIFENYMETQYMQQ